MDNPGAKGRGMGQVKEEDLKEAYECGYEDGYEEAMKEFEHKSYGRMKRYQKMNRARLDVRDKFPSGMEDYLAQNG